MDIKKIAQLKGHTGGIYSLETGRNASTIFSGSADKMIAEWSLEDFSIQNFSIKTGSAVFSIFHNAGNKQLIAGLYSGAIHVFDLEKKIEIRHITLHSSPIFDIKFSARHNRYFMASGDGSISTWDHNFSLLNQISFCREKIRNICFTADESQAVIACGDGFLRILNIETQKVIHEIKAHELSANCVCFHAHGNTLISGGRDAYLRFWDLRDNYKMMGEMPAHNYAIYSIVFSPDKKFCATASMDKTCKIWDARNFDLLARIDRKNSEGHVHSVNKLLWTAYKNYLVTASDDRTMMVWEIKS